jgi:hypothetical protein
MIKMQTACSISVRKSEEKRPFESCRHRWEDNIKMDLKEIGWDSVELNNLALLNMLINSCVP